MKEKKVADIILEQLGGHKFVVMTGSKDFLSDGDMLRMTLAKNASGANRLEITLDRVTDTYKMRFFKYIPGRLNKRTFQYSKDKIIEIKMYENVYYDMLCDLFTSVTGMDTSIPQLDRWMQTREGEKK